MISRARRRPRGPRLASIAVVAALATAGFVHAAFALVPAGYHRARPNVLLGSWHVSESEIGGDVYPMTALDITWTFSERELWVHGPNLNSTQHYTLRTEDDGTSRLELGDASESAAIQLALESPSRLALTWLMPDQVTPASRIFFDRVH